MMYPRSETHQELPWRTLLATAVPQLHCGNTCNAFSTWSYGEYRHRYSHSYIKTSLLPPQTCLHCWEIPMELHVPSPSCWVEDGMVSAQLLAGLMACSGVQQRPTSTRTICMGSVQLPVSPTHWHRPYSTTLPCKYINIEMLLIMQKGKNLAVT